MNSPIWDIRDQGPVLFQIDEALWTDVAAEVRDAMEEMYLSRLSRYEATVWSVDTMIDVGGLTYWDWEGLIELALRYEHGQRQSRRSRRRTASAG